MRVFYCRNWWTTVHWWALKTSLVKHRLTDHRRLWHRRCKVMCSVNERVVLWRFPFVSFWSVFTKKLRFTVRFRYLRFQILIVCRANTNDTGENTCIAAVQNSDLRHSGRSRRNGELIIISMLQVATWKHLSLTWSVYVKKVREKPSSTNTVYKQRTTRGRVARCGRNITYVVIQ